MSFGWLGTFRQGSWKAFRDFILNERRDVGKRIDVIDAELNRIGRVSIAYAREEDPDTKDVRITEERVGIKITKNSPLEKLMQAYIAAGGNPFDISHFFIPDQTTVVDKDARGDVKLGHRYPYGGVGYPQTSDYEEPVNSYGPYPGGYMPLRKYPPLRTGGQIDIDSEAEPFVNYIASTRRAFNKEIKYKRNQIEWRIIKLCDLREQLLNERNNILVQAFGGLVPSLNTFDPDRFVESLRVPKVVALIDEIFYEKDDNGRIDFETVNTAELARYYNLMEDILPDEAWTAL